MVTRKDLLDLNSRISDGGFRDPLRFREIMLTKLAFFLIIIGFGVGVLVGLLILMKTFSEYPTLLLLIMLAVACAAGGYALFKHQGKKLRHC